VIQRLQTLYLALAVCLNLAVFFTPLYDRAIEDPSIWISYGFAIVLTLAMILSAISIFLYKNRKNQMIWVKYTMLLQTLSLAFGVGITFSLGGIGTYLWDETLGDLLIVAGLLLQYAALYGIKKDEELVKSMDRIR